MKKKQARIYNKKINEIVAYAVKNNIDKVKNSLEDIDINARDYLDRTLLSVSCGRGHIELVEFLVEKGVDLNLSANIGMRTGSPLYLALENDNIKIARILVEAGAEINNEEFSALHYAINNDFEEFALFLIENGADIEQIITGVYRTPIWCAAKKGYLKIVESLIENNADVNAVSKTGASALHEALLNKHTEIAELLIENGADINIKDKDKITPLHYAALHGLEDIVEILLSNGVDVNAAQNYLWTPLHYAARHGFYNVAKLLMEDGAEVNVFKKDKFTPLHYAARYGYTEIAELLLANGADKNLTDKDNNTALDIAKKRNQQDIIKLLSTAIEQKDADSQTLIDAINSNDTELIMSLLEKAIKANNIELVKLFAQHSADIEAGFKADISEYEGDNDYVTPLLIATKYGDTEIAEFLINKGANVNAKFMQSYVIGPWSEMVETHSSPLHNIIKAYKYTDDKNQKAACVKIAKLLIENGAYVDKFIKTTFEFSENISNSNLPQSFSPLGLVLNYENYEEDQDLIELLVNNSAELNFDQGYDCGEPLVIAIERNNAKLLKLLLQKEVDVNNIESEFGNITALHLAAEYGHENLVKLILEHWQNLDLNQQNDNDQTALDIAISKGNLKIINMLKTYQAQGVEGALKKVSEKIYKVQNKEKVDLDNNNNKKGEENMEELFDAVKSNDIGLVKKLLLQGVDVNTQNIEGNALCIAIEHGNRIMVELLIDKGADLNKKVKVTKYDAVADIYETEQYPIGYAINNQNLEVVRLLLQKGAKIDVDDFLVLAAQSHENIQTLEIMKLLLEKGVNTESSSGYSPLHIVANDGKSAEMFKLLIEYNANINIKNKSDNNNTPLHYAALNLNGSEEIVKLLIKQGADVNAKNADGQTPLDLARENNNYNHNQTIINMLKVYEKPEIKDIVARARQKMFDDNKKESNIDNNNNKKGEENMKMSQEEFNKLLEQIKNNSITMINLGGKEIGANGMQDLVRALKSNNSITMIDLRSNAIGDSGAEVLADALKTNNTITKIGLRDNQIGDSGAQEIAKALEINNSITQIDLIGNEIGDSGVQDIAMALEGNISITKIGLGGNQIGDSGAQNLAKALENNNFIKTIGLGGNQIGDSGAQEIAKALEGNISITTIWIDNNQIGDNYINKINTLLKRNQKLLSDKNNNDKEKDDNDAVEVEELKELDDQAQQEIDKILALINEGHKRINTVDDAAILLLGNTGSGKSTLAHLLTDRPLYAQLDDEVGRFVVEAKIPSDEIKISHDKKSETKIPNKCLATHDQKVTVIWDCPGFNDTDVVQEIANSYYVQSLFDVHNKLKLILVASQGAIISDRGSSFVDTIEQFCKMFTDVDRVKDSVRLVVTGADAHKKPKHLAKEIEKIAAQNSNISDKAKDLISHLQKDVLLFHCPKEEGDLNSSPMLPLMHSIFGVADYAPVENTLNKMVLSKKAKEYCEYLMKYGHNNMSKVMSLLVKAADDTSQMTDSAENIFTKNRDLIEKFLPRGGVEFKQENKASHFNGEYFIAEKQMRALSELDKKLASIDDIVKFMNFANEIFDILIEYVVAEGDSHMQQKTVIHDYKYFLGQQFDYSQLFARLAENEKLLDVNQLKKQLAICCNKFKSNYEKAIIELEVKDDATDIGYYQNAINFLEQKENHEACRAKLALSYKKMGELYNVPMNEKYDVQKAIESYKKSLEYNEKDPEIYEELGSIADKKEEYKAAIECYLVTRNTIKIKSAFKKWISKEEENAEIREFRGDVHKTLGNFAKAIKCYDNAISLLGKNIDKVKLLELFNKKLECKEPGNWENHFKSEHFKVTDAVPCYDDMLYNFNHSNDAINAFDNIDFAAADNNG